jgi:riboflavin kinase / FMN adenylyltransferase
MFFNKYIKNYRLASEEQKLKLFKKNNVDFVINKNFNKKFSNISAQKFIKNILYKKVNPKLLAVSNNFKFGKNRLGDVNLLNKLGKIYKYRLLNIKPFKYLNKTVSSTKIRKHLKNGKIQLANKLLSRTWSIQGKVVRGKQIGRKLGYRTCNINVKNYIIPKLGIYSVKIKIEKQKKFYSGIAYIGSRPTFQGKQIFLEINIFNLNKNLYNKTLTVYFLKFLRKDHKFNNSSQLIKQMNKDVISAKKGLKTKLVL